MAVVPVVVVEGAWVPGDDELCMDVLVTVEDDNVTLKPYDSDIETMVNLDRKDWEALVKFVAERFAWLDKPVTMGGRD